MENKQINDIELWLEEDDDGDIIVVSSKNNSKRFKVIEAIFYKDGTKHVVDFGNFENK